MTSEHHKAEHARRMREYRKTEAYRKYNREYQRVYKRTGKGCKRKKGEISIPVETLNVPIETKVKLP